MSMKKVEQFFKLIEGNEVLAKRLAKINEELKNESEEFLNCEQAINERIIPFAEENGISFTAKDFLDYTNSKLPPELTREDLLNVSGGVSPKTFAITLGALLTLPFASGSLMSFADEGIGGSVPQQTQTQAATQNAANDEAEGQQEAEPKTFKYEPLYFNSYRSDEAIKNNLVNFIIENNIKRLNQIDNLLAFLDDASGVAPKIEISKNETYEGEKSCSFNGELQDSTQGSALELISKVVDKTNVWDRTLEEELEYLYGMSKNVSSLMEIPEVNQDYLAKDIEYVLENVKETSKNSKEIQHLQELLEEHARYTLEKERVDITLGHKQNPLLNYVPRSAKDLDEKMSSEEKLDDLYEVVKFAQSIKDLPKGFNLRDLIGDMENALDKVKETRANSYKVQRLRNLCNEYKNLARDFIPSPEGASLGEQINNVYDFISSSIGVTKETEEALKDAERAMLKQTIDPDTGEVREDFYINLVGKENFERSLEDLEKTSDPKAWEEKMEKLQEEENSLALKIEKIRKHYDLNYAKQQYRSSNDFEKLSPIEQLHDLYPVVSKCKSIFDVHKNTVEALRKNVITFIGENWNHNNNKLEVWGNLDAEILQELNALQRFAEESGIPFIAKLNNVSNKPNVVEIFDILLKTSLRINNTNNLPYKDAKEYKGWVEFLARKYYNPIRGTFEVPGAEGINGRPIIDVCEKSGIKLLNVGDNNPVIQKGDLTERFNKLARTLNKASSEDDLTDLEGIKKLQDLVNEYYNAKEECFGIPITEIRAKEVVVVGIVSILNGQEIIDGCKRLGIELKIDFKKLPSGLRDTEKFFYLEEMAKRINSTDDLTKDGAAAFESAGTELIKRLQTIKNSGDRVQYEQYRYLYYRSGLKRVYENSKNWPIIYFSPDKEMSQMGKINYFMKTVKMITDEKRSFKDPKENSAGEEKFSGKQAFISGVLKLGGTHYNPRTGRIEITDGSYRKSNENDEAITKVTRFYGALVAGKAPEVKLAQYKRSGRTLVQTAQNLVKQLVAQGWRWENFSPETLPELISNLQKVVSRIEKDGTGQYYLNDAWWGTNENRSISSKDLGKLKEVLNDYNSWL